MVEVVEERLSTPSSTLVSATIEHDALHLAFGNLFIDSYGAVRTKYLQLGPLARKVIHRFGHRVLGQ